MSHRAVLAHPRLLAAPIVLAACLNATGQSTRVPSSAPNSDEDPVYSTLREGFESPRPSWRKEQADDVAVQVLEHDRSNRVQHEGRYAEHVRFVSEGLGSSVYYSLALPKILIDEDTEISLYVRSNQPGIQLLARVILPADIDPDTGEPAFVSIAALPYDQVGRWQRLELPNPSTNLRAAVEQQARILRVQSRRRVDITGAYIERLVVNLYGGGGEAEVYLDDLTITPVAESVIAEFEQMNTSPGPVVVRGASTPAGRVPIDPSPVSVGINSRVRLEGSRLTRDGRDWFPTILDAPGSYLDQALPFGFDVVRVDPADASDADRVRRVVELGALLMPDLGPERASGDAVAEDARLAMSVASTFPAPEAVAFWSLGERLGADADRDRRAEELERTRFIVTGLRDEPEGFPRITTGVIADEFGKYAVPGQDLDVLGVAAQNWGTMMAPLDALQYLEQRRNLTALWKLNAPFLAWVDVAAPRSMWSAIWGADAPPAWGAPRVQPEQVRQAVYLALMAGYRGIGFHGDAGLTRDSGRSVLYELGILNAEIDLVESILARTGEGGPATPLAATLAAPKRRMDFKVGGAQGSVGRYDDKPAAEMKPLDSVRVFSIPSKDGRSRLVLIADLAAGSQWQPPQMAYNDLEIVVRGAPVSAQAYQLTLGGRRVLETYGQEVGGIRFTMPEFDTAAMVLLTTDLALAERLERELRSVRPRAVDLAIKQAQLQYEWVAEINGLLALDGAQAPDANDLLTKANLTLRSSIEALGRENYEEAWDESRRVGRSLRYLMRQHWEAAALAMNAAVRESLSSSSERTVAPVTPVVPPVASPPLVAFNTLPQHYLWCDWVRHGSFGEDLLQEGGRFDGVTPQTLSESGWTDAGHHPDRVRSSIRLVADGTPGFPRLRPAPPRGKPVGQVLELRVAPEAAGGIDAVVPFLEQPAAAIQSPPVRVAARQLVRIRVKCMMRRNLPGGAGGLIVRDSLGGEALQFRTTAAQNYWGEVVLFRRAEADGLMTVTLGLAGYGVALFDDLRIEPLGQYDPPGYAAGNFNGQAGSFFPAGRVAAPTRAAAALPLTPARTAR